MKKLVALCVTWLVIVLGNASVSAETSLQQMIDDTPENGVLELSDQVYEGNITITKPITIIGSEHTVIRGDQRGNVIEIFGSGVHLKKLSVQDSGIDRNSEEEYAAIKVHSDENHIESITISNSFHGIYLSQAHENRIEGIDVTGVDVSGQVAAQGNGIHVYYSNGNTIINNHVTGTRDGIFFDYSNENEVVDNMISETRYGLHYMYSDDNRFDNNSFSQNTGGAAIMHSRRNELTNNTFSLNQSTRSFGLLLQSANDNVVTGNEFFQNQRGVFIDQSQRNYLANNEFFQNHIGIEIWASANDQTFTENTFFRNIASVITVGGQSTNQWSEGDMGNYWGRELPLLDLDQDGVGDFPVTFESGLYQLIEENELAYLFLKSPTITIYEKMNQLLSRQKVMFVDEYPLVDGDSTPLLSRIPFFLLLVAVVAIGLRRRQLR
ncbi:nitrous oxide reductase family maturation protein NosD [Desertibacillus haloalkaliphilus]|uniref:nitrous oxide reductase family maturation protein NosD n=1 Tax=Desertibacillus haloalkaliphilus TaxID=1328930 RepID=UPI001C25CDDF|nr:nitrous oxide reductase family maturation protein NosD [Desertibacillus haloalkaliphilus]MBU8908333.1 nitrous oxide reductase family maturation protein NosD [Desertibacillus haloalkaliphilus]